MVSIYNIRNRELVRGMERIHRRDGKGGEGFPLCGSLQAWRKGKADLFLFVALFTQILAASGHFCSAHGVFFGC